MPRTLDVYLHRHLIGKLIQNDHGHMVFDYVRELADQSNRNPAVAVAA